MAQDHQKRLGPGDGYVETTRVSPEAQVEVAVAAGDDRRQRLGLGEHGGNEDDSRLLALHIVHRAYTDATQPAAAK